MNIFLPLVYELGIANFSDFLPKMLPYHCCIAVDGENKENLLKKIYIWIVCTSTEPITLFGNINVCTAKRSSLQEWPIDIFI